MNAGVPQGFIRFGCLAHRILVLMHDLGDLRHRDIAEELDDVSVNNISITLHRMARHGLIHKAGVAAAYDTGEATQAIYSLHPPLRRVTYRKATNAQRSARHRAKRKAHQAVTVFDWRPA